MLGGMAMPYCKDCGNSKYFTASQVSPVAPTATGPISGLVGKFDETGELVEMQAMGADEITRDAAAVNPVVYFDTCLECGSNRVSW
jgi:hypothetical protein